MLDKTDRMMEAAGYKVHWITDKGFRQVKISCNASSLGALIVSTIKDDVTCGNCKKTKAFKDNEVNSRSPLTDVT